MQKDLDFWLVKGFSGVHNLMRKRALDKSAGPISEQDLTALETIQSYMEIYLQQFQAVHEDVRATDGSLLELYSILLRLLDNRLSLNRNIHKDVYEYLKRNKTEIDKIVAGYRVLNQRHKEGKIPEPNEKELNLSTTQSYDDVVPVRQAWVAESQFLVEETKQLMSRGQLLALGYKRFMINYNPTKHLYWRVLESNQNLEFERLTTL